MTNEDIALLIAKGIVGNVTVEEQAALDAWRKENEHNEAAFQRLMDRQRLTVEYNRRRLTDYERPLSAMKQRLGIGRRRLPTIPYMVAAAIAILLIGGAALIWNHRHVSPEGQPMAQTTIQAGHTQAMLTRSNGETLSLTDEADMEKLKALPNKEISDMPSSKTSANINSLATPRGGEFKVTLEDGTEVWLNADTRLRYPENFEGAERRVELEGEAYFKVAKNEDKPFYVVSGGQEVRVYGTEFNINGYAEDTAIRTTLVEGSISLRPIGGNGSELMLTPGSQAVFDKHESRARVQQVDTEVVTSWRSGTFVFEDQTMEQIMQTLSRWYDFLYEFSDPQLASTVFMGSIPRYGSFAEVAQIFEKMGGIRLRQKADKVIISER
jgi:ferric-dicitrate binding protein FerR (iron transport regulator)